MANNAEMRLKSLLSKLGFDQTTFSKKFNFGAANEFEMKVDFENEKLIYPDKLKINEQQTTNFSAAENFVVFECVHRLLESGCLLKQ